MLIIPTALADNSHLSRVSKDTLSQQTLMELLVQHIDDKYSFTDSGGSFTDISHWDGVRMNSKNTEVEKIEWAFDLVDPFGEVSPIEQGGSIDFQWIPSTVCYFDISDVKLLGNIDTHILPVQLVNLLIRGNRLSGSFAIEGLPPTIQKASISLNDFSGSLHLHKLPPSIVSFDAAGNRFSGTLNFSSLHSIRDLVLSNNSFTGSMCLENLPPSIKNLQFDGNAFEQSELRVSGGLTRLWNMIIDRSAYETLIVMDGNNYEVMERHGVTEIRSTRERV